MKFKAIKICLLTLCLLGIFLSVVPATLAGTEIDFTPNVKFFNISPTKVGGSTLGTFISGLAMLMTQLLVGFTIFMIILYGFQWILYANNSSKITAAKTNIIKALIGLTIGVFAVTILKTVSPGTTEFQPLSPGVLKDWICCDMTKATPPATSIYLPTAAECKLPGRAETDQAKKLEICGAQMPSGSTFRSSLPPGNPDFCDDTKPCTGTNSGKFCSAAGACTIKLNDGDDCVGMTFAAAKYKASKDTGDPLAMVNPTELITLSKDACASGDCAGAYSGGGTLVKWADMFSTVLFGTVGTCGGSSFGSGALPNGDPCLKSQECQSQFCSKKPHPSAATKGTCTATISTQGSSGPCGTTPDNTEKNGNNDYACTGGSSGSAECRSAAGQKYCFTTSGKGGAGELCNANSDCATNLFCLGKLNPGDALTTTPTVKGPCGSGCSFGNCHSLLDSGVYCDEWAADSAGGDDSACKPSGSGNCLELGTELCK